MRLSAVLAMMLVVGACTGRVEGELIVSAAASLVDAFTEIEAEFEAANPGIDIVFNFGASSALREAIIEGAPVDVFASANISNMDQVVDADRAEGEPVTFATNLLQIAVPAGNPGGVTGLSDFADPDLLIGLCEQGVPCGDFGREALANAGVEPSIDTNEPDVRALLTKIEAGELDAGITYVTDVRSSVDVEGIEIPLEHNVVARYPIALISSSPNPAEAEAFIEFVLSGAGQMILQSHGFTAP